MSEARSEYCVSCGAPRPGNYCAACGERRITDADRRLVTFLRRGAEAVTDIDSRLLRTLRRLVFSPGYLAQAFATGRRRPYLGPVQLFLLANLAYFLLQPLSDYYGYNTPLMSQLESQGYSSLLPVSAWVDAAATRAGLEPATFAVVYNNQSELLARSLVFVMVPLFAGFLAPLMLGAGRPFVDHLVFSLHYFAFDLLAIHCVVLMAWPWLVSAVVSMTDAVGITGVAREGVVAFVTELAVNLLITVPYLYLAFRRFYGLGGVRAAVTALIGLVVLYLTISVYRLLLLMVTLATL